jgi:hypothetical protein
MIKLANNNFVQTSRWYGHRYKGDPRMSFIIISIFFTSVNSYVKVKIDTLYLWYIYTSIPYACNIILNWIVLLILMLMLVVLKDSEKTTDVYRRL